MLPKIPKEKYKIGYNRNKYPEIKKNESKHAPFGGANHMTS